MPSTERVVAEFELSPEADAVLAHMVESGLYGEDAGAALRELVLRGLREYLRAAELGICPRCDMVGSVNKLCPWCASGGRQVRRRSL